MITLIWINTLVCPFRNIDFKTQQTELFLINMLFSSHERELKCRTVIFLITHTEAFFKGYINLN